MDVSDTGAAATTVIGVVRDGEETDTLSQFTLGADLLVEVFDDGDIHGGGASLNPVLAQLVAVTVVDGLNGVAQVVQDAGEGIEGPASAAGLLPSLAVVFEGTERDQGVVAGATAQNLCARVTDVAVTCAVEKKA